MKLFWAFFCITSVSIADVNDLVITEVVPSTGRVEVTNFGNSFTTGANIPFSHGGIETDAIPPNTSFAEDEAKVFTVNLSNPADSDLWLYKEAPNFGDANDILSGLKWGPTDNVGRENLATAGGKWDGTLLPTPADGASLQLVKSDPTRGASWTEAFPSLGQYPDPAKVFITTDGTTGTVSWIGGTEPFIVQEANSLDSNSWINIFDTPITDRSLPVLTEDTKQFYRVLSNQQTNGTARFRVTFTGLWSTDRFAIVPQGAHFSQLIGATHNGDPFDFDFVSFWEGGQFASPGIEQMAETGNTSLLQGEISDAILFNQADQVIAAGGPSASGNSVSVVFTASPEFSYLTLVSMIAPSPDWFVGINSVNLFDDISSDWFDTLNLNLVAYDAGTDSGDTFDADDQDTSPAERIFMIPANDPNFLPPSGSPGSQPIPIANFLIERIN